MKISKWPTLVSALVVGTVLLSGCGAQKTVPSTPPAANATQKPPLAVPNEFANMSEKRDFAVKAISQDYYEEAAVLLSDVVRNSPTDAVAQANLGVAKYMLNQFDEAAQAWAKAAELNVAIAGEMQNNIGNALRDSKQTTQAKVAYQKALQLEPTRWSAAVNLADVLKQEGNLSEAITVLKSAVAANPKEIALLAVANRYEKEASRSN